MKTIIWKRVLSLVLILALAASAIGCGGTENSNVASTPSDESMAAPAFEFNSEDAANLPEDIDGSSNEASQEAALTDEVAPEIDEAARQKAEEEARIKAEEEKELAEQRNSFSMMYYLAITAEEIRTSKNNRMVLEEIYTSLLNDINPGAVDEITQDHLKNLRDIIKSYLSISTKRERLRFIYNQEKAAAIRSAVPNPLAILSVANAFNMRELALAVVYTAVDSFTSYKQASENADMEFLVSGWDLDDEEKAAIMKNRDRAFDYMVDMVQEYHLDGRKTLNEKAIERFAEICATENAAERIRLLLAEESEYQLLGNYWLELADAYFETSRYDKCLECVNRYNELATGIYRKDYNYLRILPKAIVAAGYTYSGEEYAACAKEYADAIILNTSLDDWSSRYFAATVYMDLYAKTNDQTYLDTAYQIASENVAELLKSQRDINATYMNDVVEMTAAEPDYRFMNEQEKEEAEKEYKAEEKRVKKYNKAMKNARKTELPTLYEPLIINCELLFSLADQMGISDSEKSEMEAILQTDTNGIFMVKPINDMYSFSRRDNTYSIEFLKDEIIIPANLLTAESHISVTVKQGGETFTFDDCVVDEVKREGTDIDSFSAHIVSKQLKKHKWSSDAEITVEITYGDAYGKQIQFDFVVSEFTERKLGDKVVFTAK